MKMHSKLILTGLFLAFSLFNLSAQKESLKGVFTEKQLPSLSINDMYGKKVNVAEYGENDKITVLSFWATWCSPCKKELNNISYLYEDWQDDYDMELVAISIDDVRNTSKVKTYVDGQAWDYDVLLDTNEDLKRMMNFQTVPYTVLIDQRGKIVYTHSGYVEGDEYILEDYIKELIK
ncbi:MAG: TlpA disulfide reductase family protein [Chitinophagales bacterium]|jgi:cytochrome c biogenesis protein CcmG, thiol:disulfide interchange protein DsbE|nr:TlpA family protein disulfide reductase [Chitinophagales bacterium]|tara:strand:- start:11056 stop:11586 length:531 start_codon:yes stop_codon:yes gene_type:complete